MSGTLANPAGLNPAQIALRLAGAFVSPIVRVDGGLLERFEIGDASMGLALSRHRVRAGGAELGVSGGEAWSLPAKGAFKGDIALAAFGAVSGGYDRSSVNDGMTLKAPRDRRGEAPDDDYHAVAARLVDFMLHVVGGVDPEGGEASLGSSLRNVKTRPVPEGAGGRLSDRQLWRAFVDEFGDTDRVSFAHVDDKVNSGVTAQASVGGVARFGHDHFRVGPSVVVGATVRHASGHQHDGSGALQSHRYNLGTSFSLVADTRLASLGTPSFADIPGKTAIGLNGMPIAGVNAVATPYSQAVALNLEVERDTGHLRPSLCYRDAYFNNARDLGRYLAAPESAWRDVETLQYETLAGDRLEGEAARQAFDREARDLPRMGAKTFGERLQLTERAGAEINLRRDRLRMLDRLERRESALPEPLKREQTRLEGEIEMLFRLDSSWQRKYCFIAQTNAKESSFGPSFVVKAATEGRASTDHIMAILSDRRPIAAAEGIPSVAGA